MQSEASMGKLFLFGLLLLLKILKHTTLWQLRVPAFSIAPPLPYSSAEASRKMCKHSTSDACVGVASKYRSLSQCLAADFIIFFQFRSRSVPP